MARKSASSCDLNQRDGIALQHLFLPARCEVVSAIGAGNIPYWRETYVRIDSCYNHSREPECEVEVFGGFQLHPFKYPTKRKRRQFAAPDEFKGPCIAGKSEKRRQVRALEVPRRVFPMYRQSALHQPGV